MKLKYLLMTGLALASFTSCNDYLDVDSPSKYSNDYVYGSETEINRALNGVYDQLLNSNTYGGAYLTTFCMNSDVDFVANSNEATTNNGYTRFECTNDASDLKKTWPAAYTGVEYANNFISNLSKSSLYDVNNATYGQMMGEAKVIRAIFYNDLIDLWGDVPFSMQATYEKEDFVLPVTDREEIRKQLIADLIEIAPHMQFSSSLDNTVERVSKEACWAMIARLALSAGGYSLHPDKTNATNRGTMSRPSIMPSFDVFTGGRKMAVLKLRKFEYEEALHNYQKSILTGIQEVNDSAATAKRMKKNYYQSYERLQLENKDFELITRKKEIGATSELEVLHNKEAQLMTKADEVSNKINFLISTISLYKAVGGQDFYNLNSTNNDVQTPNI